ncbi:reverse transcriptase domain-containing protein [Tanacetum coccineum]
MQKEKEQQDKLNAVKARLLYGNETGKNQRNHEESHYSESKTTTARTEPKRRHGNRRSGCQCWEEKNEVHLRVLTAAIRVPMKRKPRCNRWGIIIGARRPEKLANIRSEDGEGGHWKSKSRRHRSNTHEDDLSQPRTCEERNPFTPRIRHFNFPRTRMPSHVKTYDGSGDSEDHLKLFQAAAKTERWAMPTWCHMFNSTLTGYARVWFDKLLREFIDSNEDLRTTFRENYLQQTKHIKDPVEIHHIKQRDGESTEDFMERYKAEILDVEGAPECMKISGFMYGITHPELIKCLYEKILRSMDEMYKVTTSFLQGEVAAFSHNRFSLLTKTPKEIVALEKGKFKAPPPMVTPTEKRDPNKYCEFHADTGHSTDECMQLRKQIDEMIKSGKLLQFIKELKQNGEEDGTEGPMIIEAEIGGHFVHRIYVDGGASSEVLYEHCFLRLRPEIRSQMIPATTSLIGFSGETIWPIGQISLLVKIGDEEYSTSAWMNFMVIRSPSQHNGIIGRTGKRKIRAVPSTAHGMLKFPVKGGTWPFILNTPSIGSTLTEKGRKELCALLRQNLDIFAWKPADMTGVLRHMAEHCLNVREGCLPVRQKKRGQAPERNKAIQEEVEKLVDAGIIKEVHYHSWLSNPVMVKKHDGGYRMCVDFKDLNKAFPQDAYPLPEIDWKVESLCGSPFKCFLDACKGYHQIKMAEEDEEKTAFITSQGIFCYTKMSFSLKNVGATYQRLVDRAFQKHIGRNLELRLRDVLKDVQKLNGNLGKLKTRFLSKQAEKITAVLQNPKEVHKDEAISNGLMGEVRTVSRIYPAQSSGCLKDVQKLNGKLASLNRFLSKSAEKSLPFFKTLKKCTKKDFIVEQLDEESPDELMAEPEEFPESWTLFTDGSSYIDGSGARLILTNPKGVEFTYAMRFRFEATKNEAEYEALIAGLRIAEQMGVKNLQANVDSLLVANQVNGSYVAKESGMVQYLEKVKTLPNNFKEFSNKQVPRSENKKADALSKIASTSFAHLSKQVLVEELKEKSIHEKEVLAIVEEEEQTWMKP